MEPPRLDWRIKGLPPRCEGLSGAELGRLGLTLHDLPMPAALLRQEALAHNIAAMQAFADANGALLCPHGKTSMSPELFAMQMAAGAWGITAATAHHVRVYRRFGIRRIFLASQLAAPADIDLVLGELAADPALDFYCLVDSAEGAARLGAEAASLPRPLQVLIETGVEGGRAGVRDLASAKALARAVAAEPTLALRGVETFEGVRQTATDARREAGAMLKLARDAAEAIAAEGLFAPGPVIFSAGGSAFLDLVAAALPQQLGGAAVERVIRPGCYVTHDHGLYARIAAGPQLRAAIELWGAVLSLPEPVRAIVGLGKRDTAYDVEPPIPLWHARPGAPVEPLEGATVSALWDQHLALDVGGAALAVGDLVGFGISHPCAAFDRWRALLLVDEDRRVAGAVTTCF